MDIFNKKGTGLYQYMFKAIINFRNKKEKSNLDTSNSWLFGTLFSIAVTVWYARKCFDQVCYHGSQFPEYKIIIMDHDVWYKEIKLMFQGITAQICGP